MVVHIHTTWDNEECTSRRAVSDKVQQVDHLGQLWQLRDYILSGDSYRLIARMTRVFGLLDKGTDLAGRVICFRFWAILNILQQRKTIFLKNATKGEK